jgi:hypothetical protein
MTREPAEVFHPSTYIAEELEARGWTIGDLAKRLPGDYGTNHLALEMYLMVGACEGMHMGDMAPDISKAFGVSPDFFSNLERAWLAGHRRVLQ